MEAKFPLSKEQLVSTLEFLMVPENQDALKDPKVVSFIVRNLKHHKMKIPKWLRAHVKLIVKKKEKQ